MKYKLKGLYEFALNSFFPVRCPYCDIVIDPQRYACDECSINFPEIPITTYIEGGYRCIAPFLYKDNFAEAVKRFKFNNRAQYAKALAFAIITALGSAGTDLDFDYITCVPMHKEQKLNRGYNQSELLAKECADLMRTKYIHSLEKYKKNQVQHTLSGAERRKNVKGVYRPINKEMLKGKRVLLIDDIITTGSTLAECTKILSKCGCSDICCAAVCSAD